VTFFNETVQNMKDRTASCPQMAAGPLPINSKTTVPSAPRLAWRCLLIELLIGFPVLILALLAGELLKSWLHLAIPGNVLGLFLLLLSFRFRLIPPRLIEDAANRLLYFLPSLFIPIYVSGIGQAQLWSRISWILFPTLTIATAGLWVFVGHLAQKLLRRSIKDE
jgi:holin-like protein